MNQCGYNFNIDIWSNQLKKDPDVDIDLKIMADQLLRYNIIDSLPVLPKTEKANANVFWKEQSELVLREYRETKTTAQQIRLRNEQSPNPIVFKQ